VELWTLWTQWLVSGLAFLSSHFGLSEAVAIVVLTLVARAAMMPISLAAAYRMQVNKEAMERLKPRLEQLRGIFRDDPAQLSKHTLALYRENGIAFFDRIALLNAGSQGVFGIGIYHALDSIAYSSRFLWIANLAKPDFYLTVLVGALMLLGMALMPGGMTEPQMLMMAAVAVVISVVAVAALPSAVGVYWATSNAFSVVQTLALRALLWRRERLRA
jgi:YidC/Oxa1 family membrane protein insertase